MIMYEATIEYERDIVMARQKAREIARELSFSLVDQTRIITAVSELARNIYEYAGTGQIIIEKKSAEYNEGLMITFTDQGPGIEDIELAMQEGYTTRKGLGVGLPGSKRLMDDFEIVSAVGKGTTVIITKWL